MIEITPEIALDEAELEFSFIRASGPGGQHVNKVATAAQLRFDARRCRSLPPDVLARLEHAAGARLTNDGVIVITARRYRSQERNRAEAVDRLARLIVKAATVAPERRITRVPRTSRQSRLTQKARRAVVKSLRAQPGADD